LPLPLQRGKYFSNESSYPVWWVRTQFGIHVYFSYQFTGANVLLRISNDWEKNKNKKMEFHCLFRWKVIKLELNELWAESDFVMALRYDSVCQSTRIATSKCAIFYFFLGHIELFWSSRG
jgi:hypothetical protein